MFRGRIRAEAGIRQLPLATIVLLATFAAALVGGFLNATRAADEATWSNEQQLLQNHIQVTTRALMEAEGVQLTWDDAMRKVGGQGGTPDLAWADTFVGQFLHNSVHVDETFLVTPRGDLIRAWRDGKPVNAGVFSPIAARVRGVLGRLADNRSLSGTPTGFRELADTHWPVSGDGRPLMRWYGAVIDYQGRPAIMTVMSLVPDAQFSLLRRTPSHVVALRHIEGGMLSEMGKALLFQDLRFTRTAPEDRVHNHLALIDAHGQVLGWFSWTPRAVGSVVVARTAPLLIAYLGCFCLVLALAWALSRRTLRVTRELAASEARAQHQALHDPLLGLPNRTHVLQRLHGMLKERRPDGDQVVLAYFDLDRFKSINETVGHHVGDDVLAQVATRINAAMRPGDVLGRLASDEFVLVRCGSDGEATADALGEELMEAFAEPFSVFGQSVRVTASCGISWAPEQAQEAKGLMCNADIALFQAKARGRARYRRFTAEMDATIRWRRDMEVELRRAIALDHLAMVYQPIVNAGDAQIASFEALLRWHHPDRGEISPGTFVPAAEQAGLMPELGEWVLRRVFADSRDFGKAEISVNLSPLQLVAKDFLPQLKTLMREESVDPSRFTFEITEGVLLDRSQRVMDLLSELQDMGFRIALDDFGTGYSSLAYLRAFEFDRIKIDRSFVQGIENDVDAQSILRAIVALGRTLRMKVVAEGVETVLQQQLVHAAGCQFIQGFLYWRGLTPDQVIELLATDRIQSLRLAV